MPCLFSVTERSFLGEEKQHLSRLALCLVQKLDAFASPHSLGLNPVRVAPHLTSKLSQESRLAQALSQASISGIYRLGLSVWFTPETERVVVLSKILALNKSLALQLSVLLAASVGTITIEQYRRISCHDNFVKAKDASSRVRDRSWKMTFYL